MQFSPDVKAAIERAAQEAGVSPMSLYPIAWIESRGNPNAKNGRSSAGGLFQQIDSNAAQYGVKNRYDPYQSALGAAKFMRDNQNYLRQRLGREPTVGELYLAHQQGAGGAVKLLSNPNAQAASIVGNSAVRLNGGRDGMTAQDLANLWINKAQKLVGGDVATAPQQTAASVSPAASMAATAQPQSQPQNQPQATDWRTMLAGGGSGDDAMPIMENSMGSRVASLLKTLTAGQGSGQQQQAQSPQMPEFSPMQGGAPQGPTILQTLTSLKPKFARG